tara:strand:- start:655 stop:852 length:198 start_codon:yes stop_codon:yes gene_type:complete
MLQEEILEEMNNRIKNIEGLTQGSLESLEIQCFMNAEKLEEIEKKIMLIFEWIMEHHSNLTPTPQ